MNNRSKLKNIEQANLMMEQSYLKSKGPVLLFEEDVVKYNGTKKEENEKAAFDFISKLYWIKSKGEYREIEREIDNSMIIIKAWLSDVFESGDMDVSSGTIQGPLDKRGQDLILKDVKKYIEDFTRVTSTGKYSRQDIRHAMNTLSNIF
jgi:hypothetical protein